MHELNNNPWPTQFTLPCPTTNALHSVGVIKCTKTPKKNTFTIKLKLADTDTQPSTTNTTTTTIALAAMTQEVIYSHHVDMSIESIYQIMLNAMDIIWQLEDVPLNALHYEAFAIGKHGSSACTAINNTYNTTTTSTSTITYTLQQLLSMAEAYLVTTPTPTPTNNNRAAKTSKDTNSTANNNNNSNSINNTSNIGEDMKGMTYLKSGDIPMNFITHYLDILNLQNNTNTNNSNNRASNIVFPTPSLNFIPVHAENQDTALHATFRRSLAGLIR